MPKHISWRQTPLPQGWIRLQFLYPAGEESRPIEVLYHSGQNCIYWRGQTYSLKPAPKTPTLEHKSEIQEPTDIRAIMSGTVSEIAVQAGDLVQTGDLLCILEAMKMRLEVTASQNGKIAKILVEPQETVRVKQLILQLETEQAPGAHSD